MDPFGVGYERLAAFEEGMSARADSKESISIVGARIRTTSNLSMEDVSTRCRLASHASEQSPPKSQRPCLSQPLPQADIDWLLESLSKEELEAFDRRFFRNDSQRRFRMLDTDGTGLLDKGKLQNALVLMFPTLKLDLTVDGHHIPALDKSIPSVIATFDSDADGCLDLDDFVGFLKFQQAWRSQFYVSRERDVKPPVEMRKNSSLPSLVPCSEPSSAAPRPCPTSKGHKIKDINKGYATASLVSSKSKVQRGSWSRPMRASTTNSTSRRSRGVLDASRGAFYSSLLGVSSLASTI